MKCFQLSKALGIGIFTLSLAMLPSDVPTWAHNPNEFPINLSESGQNNFEEAQRQFQKAAQEAKKGVEAAGQAAGQQIDEALREAEKKISEEANWGWLGLLGLIGLFGLAGRGKRREKRVTHQGKAKYGSSN